ncbi:phage major capsid protein, partial [Salmonella enterica subsp. enterica serovar Typhimurium]
NPAEAWEVRAQYTHLNANGAYVTAMPYNIRIVESEFAPQGQIIAFVRDRYDAFIGGGVNIKMFNQTLAMEDMDLYTAKQFAYGKAHDNKASVVYT